MKDGSSSSSFSCSSCCFLASCFLLLVSCFLLLALAACNDFLPRPPVPNVAFWTYKTTSCLPAAKPHKRHLRHTKTAGSWGTDRVCGPRPPVPNVTFWTYKKTSCLTQNGAFATPKQQGPEGRTGPAGHGPQCLTSLSDLTRKLAVWAVFQPPKASQTAPPPHQNSRALRDGPGLRATAPSA